MFLWRRENCTRSKTPQAHSPIISGELLLARIATHFPLSEALHVFWSVWGWHALEWSYTAVGWTSQKNTEVVPASLWWMVSTTSGENLYCKRQNAFLPKISADKSRYWSFDMRIDNDTLCIRGIDIWASIGATQACTHSTFPVCFSSEQTQPPLCHKLSKVLFGSRRSLALS